MTFIKKTKQKILFENDDTLNTLKIKNKNKFLNIKLINYFYFKILDLTSKTQ